MITIITPVYNEEKNIEELYSRIDEVFNQINEKYELLFVDNGSSDKSLKIIKNLNSKHSQIKYISLTKNFGHQGGVWAGIYNTNNTCIILDADLQHPPESIPEMIKKWKEGFKVVNTHKKFDQDKRIWKKIFSNIFYSIINKLTKLNLKSGQSDFCLIDSTIIDIIKKLPERKTFIRGILNSLGYEFATIEYTSNRRKQGKSKFSFGEYLNLAFDGIASFSVVPINIFFWIGIITSLICLLYIIYILAIVVINIINIDGNVPWYFFLNGNYSDLFPPGWATLIIVILFIGSIQLIGLGILGKYIALTLENVKKKPEFFVKEKSD